MSDLRERVARAIYRSVYDNFAPKYLEEDAWQEWLDEADAAIAAGAGAVSAGPWRVGSHYGIHVYAGDVPVATFHRAEDAARAVAAVNRPTPPAPPETGEANK